MTTTKTKKGKPERANARKPAANDPITVESAKQICAKVQQTLANLLEFAANMRKLDRIRHNNVGLKRFGFIDGVYNLAEQYPEYLPHWITTERFKNDIDIFVEIERILDSAKQIEEIANNLKVKYGDIIFTNANEYYISVREAYKRGIDGAETIYDTLKPFFAQNKNKKDGQPTKKELIRDAKALFEGRKDGKIVIENVSPKLVGGEKTRIDETFSQKDAINETNTEEIT